MRRRAAPRNGMLDAADFRVRADGKHDDTAALQSAIHAAEEIAATLHLPSGVMRITAPLEIAHPMTLAGAGAYVLYGPQANGFDTIDIPLVAPYVSGSVLLVDGNYTDGLRLTGRGLHVNLRDFCVRFARPYAETGHGIVAEPPLLDVGGRDNGVQGATWERIAVHGHDGDHYAFRLFNPIYDSFRDLRGFGGGFIYLENDAAGTGGHYGNCLFDHPYGQLYVAGSADGIRLVDTLGVLNLLCFIRPQISTTDKSASTGAPGARAEQRMFHSDPGVRSVSLIAPDFETNVGGTCLFGDGPGWFIDVGGRISSPALWDVMSGSVTLDRRLPRLRSDMTVDAS
ncbi:MAG TPA: glycosyl hydrolase family 28-related protein [Candidatus Dormibacteraeota bacterium]|nr:glycosyl hydrolase family 28-related protein [Candidatus Dormibacteraeota bacterium]